MLVLDGESLAVIDSTGREHQAASAAQLWSVAQELVTADDAPALASAPAAAQPPQQGQEDRKTEIDNAVAVLGGKIKETAEKHYGAPLVGATVTVAGAVATRVSGVLQRVSRGNRGWRTSGRGRARGRSRGGT